MEQVHKHEFKKLTKKIMNKPTNKTSYFDPIDLSLITPLEDAIEEFKQEKNINEYEYEVFKTDNEAKERHLDHKENLKILDLHLDLANQLNGQEKPNLSSDFIIQGPLDIRKEIPFEPEEIATLLAGLSRLKNEKKFYTIAQTKAWLINLGDLMPYLRNVPNEVISRYKALDDDGKPVTLSEIILGENGNGKGTFPSRIDGLDVDFPRYKLIHIPRSYDNALFNLFWDKQGVATEYTKRLLIEISQRISKQLHDAAIIYDEWITTTHPEAITANYILNWAENINSFEIDSLNLKVVKEVFNRTIQNYKETIEIEESKNDKASPDTHINKEIQDQPKLKTPERRELVLTGWLIGKGYKIGDKVNETREDVWNELKATNLRLFNYDAIQYNKDGIKELAPTPEKFFKEQSVCSFI